MIARRFAEVFSRGVLFAAVAVSWFSGPAAGTDTYWDRYLACLNTGAGAGHEAECRTRMQAVCAAFSGTTATAAAIAGSIECHTDTEFFTGTGVVVDRASCGPRAANASCAIVERSDHQLGCSRI